MLHGGAHRVLDRSAVEAADRLKLVERHHHLAAPGLGELGGQREHFLGEARDVAVGARVRKGDPHRGGAASGRIDPGVGRRSMRVDEMASRSQRARAVRFGLGGRERARVTLEEGHVRAEAADGDLDRQRALPRHRRQRAADQRGLAVAPGRDQEHLLAGGEIARPAGRARRRGRRTPRPAPPRRRRTDSVLRQTP